MLAFLLVIAVSLPVVYGGYAVDMVQVGTASNFQCLANLGYTRAIFRAYCSDGQGYFEQNAVTNIRNSQNYLVSKVYMAPSPLSTKQGADQFDEMYFGLRAAGVAVTNVWLQVTEPAKWSNNYQQNINFIKAILDKMRSYGVRPGIYTSSKGWGAITGNWQGAGTDVLLWYWNTSGWGQENESATNFNDFTSNPFGAWTAPVMKQYGQGEVVCGVVVDKNFFQG